MAKSASVGAADPVQRLDLLTAQIEKDISRVEIKRIDFAAGQRGGAHLHPCPVVGYIEKGSIYFQIQGEAPRTLNAGEAFFEPANATVLHFDNASEIEPARFVAFYILGKNDRELIRMQGQK